MGFASFFLAVAAHALGPSDPLAIHQWDAADGLPHNSVTAIVQDDGGFLWLGTQAGLARFDGSRFVVLDRAGRDVPHDSVNALALDRGGRLWVGTNGPLLRTDGAALVDAGAGSIGWAIRSLAVVTDGALWSSGEAGVGRGLQPALPEVAYASALFAERDGTLWLAGDGVWRRSPTGQVDRPVDVPAVTAVEATGEGGLWVGTDAGLVRWRDGAAERWSDGLSDPHVTALLRDSDGTVWIGTRRGLDRWTEARGLELVGRRGLANAYVRALYEDRDGSVWVGTRVGLFRLSHRNVTVHDREDGLADDYVYSVHQGPDGAVWLGTLDGVARRVNGAWERHGPAQGLAATAVRAVYADRDGAAWAGGADGLWRFDGSTWTAALTGTAVRAIFEDAAGDLWVGGSALWRGRGGRFEAVPAADLFVWAIAEGPDGTVWLGTNGAGLWSLRGGELARWGPRDARTRDVMALRVDDDGTVWAGTYGGGILRLRDGVVTRFTEADGLADGIVFQLLDDGRGALWMGSNRGISRVERDDLEQVAAGRIPRVAATWFGRQDGMVNAEVNGGGSPAGWVDRDGLLWFPTVRGVAVIDPELVRVSSGVPQVHVERLVAGGADVAPGAVLTAGTDRFEFHYTALNLVDPEKVRFRIRLDGFDGDWVDVGGRRVAYYTRLPPGSYVFQVTARNADGEWNPDPAIVRFELLPHLIQRPGFWVAIGVGAVLAVLAWVGALHRRRRELEGLVESRTRELQTANAELTRLSAEDPVTGIANARTLRVRLDREWRRAQRARVELSVVLVDVDWFKAYNDTVGHEAGNDALRRVGQALSGLAQREGDIAARYGGEEFAVVLPGTSSGGAEAFAERARAAIRALALAHPGSPLGVLTASVGVATAVPGEEEDSGAVLRLADEAMYRAKADGRDRVRVHRGPR